MITAENSESAIALRRYKSELYTTGFGYILFGLWSTLKVIMSVFLGDLALRNVVKRLDVPEDDESMVVLFYVLIIVIVVVVVLFGHLYVGLGAIRASRGAKKKAFLILAKILAVVNVLSLLGYLGNFSDLSDFTINDTTIASFLVDLTVTLLLFGMIRADKMIKRLTA